MLKRFIYKTRNFKKIIGIILAVIGSIIVIQAVPLSVWIFFLGLLLIALGWTFFRMF